MLVKWNVYECLEHREKLTTPSSGPATLAELQAQFHSEEACADYLFAYKWPNGFSCSRCSHTEASRINSRRLPLYQCTQCHYQASPIVGTIMENSSTDLRKWFTAMYLVSSTVTSIHALRLSAIIQVTYKTAWLMLRKIRQAITQADASFKLMGKVTIDVARCGKPLTHSVYSEPDEFPVLIGKAATRLDQPDYVKIQLVPESHYNDSRILPLGISGFREQHIAPDANVSSHTLGVGAIPNNKPSDPFVEQARNWMQHTFFGLQKRHLQHYLNEFTWRLNMKLRKLPLFESMLKLCAVTPSTTYSHLLIQY